MASSDYLIDVTDARDSYIATGGEIEIPYNFAAEDRDQVIALRNGTALVEGVDYSIPTVGEGNKGEIKLDATAFPTGAVEDDKFVIYRVTLIHRQTDFEQLGNFDGEHVNTELDLQIMMMQELQRDISRSMRLAIDADPVSVILPSFDENKAIVWGFDEDGNKVLANSAADITGIENAQTWALAASTSAASAAVSAAAAAAAAGAALGISLVDADLDTSVSVETSTDSDAIDLTADGSLVATFDATKIELGRGSTPAVYVDVLDDAAATTAAGDNGALRVQGGASIVGAVHAASFHGDGSALTNTASNVIAEIIYGLWASQPTNTLPCDGLTIGDVGSGADYTHADYEELFDILKTWTELGNVGSESFAGADTVKLPNHDQRFARVGSGSTGDEIGKTGGAASKTIAAANLPQLAGTTNGAGGHSHSMSPTFRAATTPGGGAATKGLPGDGSAAAALVVTNTAGSHSHAVTVNAGSLNTAISILPPYLNLKAAIRYA